MAAKISSTLIGILAFCTLMELRLMYAAVTEEQMWDAAKLMRDVCQPKFPKVSKEVADGIRNGNIPNEKDAKCYINCILEMMQTIKKGKFLLESSLKQVDILLPEEYKDDYRNAINICKNASIGIKNHCDSAYSLLLCLRSNAKVFVFP